MLRVEHLRDFMFMMDVTESPGARLVERCLGSSFNAIMETRIMVGGKPSDTQCTEPNIILWILWGRKKMALSYHGDVVRVS